MQMTLHHVGCLVENISTALETYKGTCLARDASAPVTVSTQKVRVCFLPTGNGTFIEFVEPDADNAFLLRMLRKGTSYYHVGYVCSDVDECVKQLVSAGAREMVRFQSEAFEGRICVFLTTSQGQAIELIQAAS